MRHHHRSPKPRLDGLTAKRNELLKATVKDATGANL